MKKVELSFENVNPLTNNKKKTSANRTFLNLGPRGSESHYLLVWPVVRLILRAGYGKTSILICDGSKMLTMFIQGRQLNIT